MKCPKCNNEIMNDSLFCTECGAKIEDNNVKMIPVTFKREKRIMGFAISFPVYVDNNRIGELKNDGVLSCNIPVGEHKITIKPFEKDVNQDIELNENHTGVDIIISLKMGIIAGRANIKQVIYK